MCGCAWSKRVHRDTTSEVNKAWVEKKEETTVKEKVVEEKKKTNAKRRVTTYHPDGRITVDENLSVTVSDLRAYETETARRTAAVNAEVKQKEKVVVDVDKRTKPAGFSFPWWVWLIIAVVILVLVGRVVLRRFPSLSVPSIVRALVSRFARMRR